MANVVLVDRLGDISFGLPNDISPDKKPWAYYELLGIPKDASPQEIKKAVRRLSIENHPDKFATHGSESQAQAEERQKLINKIGDVLLDDGGEIGAEWSRHKLYDKTSRYSEFFGAEHINNEGCRTITIAENLLDLLELKKKGIEAKHKFKTDNPEVAEELENLEKAIEMGDEYSARRSHERIIKNLAGKEGITLIEFEKKQEEAIKEYKKREREKDRRNSEFAEGLLSKLRHNVTSSNTSEVETHKIFDIWYNGEINGSETVTFGTSSFPYCSIVGFEESGGVVRLGLKGSAELSGIRKVHFKAQHANVIITDAHLEGIIQLVNGRVIVEYEGSSYGSVIRVRAPKVNAGSYFVQHGDLYVPVSFAAEGWKEREPKVDIAVFNGTVDLRMKEKTVQKKRSPTNYDDIFGNSLEVYLYKKYNNDINNKIK